jgi:hypothetical protein
MSASKQAYPVRTDDDGVRACSGTLGGPIPVDERRADGSQITASGLAARA